MLKRKLFWYGLAALFFALGTLGTMLVLLAAIDARSGYVLARGGVGVFLVLYISIACFLKGQK